MANFGLSSEGFNVPRTADFLQTIRDEYEAQTGLSIDFDRDTFLGQITAITASRLGELADLVQAAADAFDVTNASGKQLDNLAILVGLTRQAATFSQATGVLTGTAETVVPAGRLVEGGGDNDRARWEVTEDTTLVSTVLSTGDLTFTDVTGGDDTIDRTTGSWFDDGVAIGTQLTIAGSASNDQVVEVTGVLSAVQISVSQALTTEGPVSATATGGFASVTVEATDPGAVQADPNTIDKIVQPIAGWRTITNPSQAATGQGLETDSELRSRRQNSLQISGAASLDAIRSNLLALSSLTAAVVIENDTLMSTVVAGKTLNPKSFLAVVWPNTITTAQQQEVAETIYNLAPAGIEIEGDDVTANVEGADGFTKVVPFDFATTLDIDVVTTVVLASGFVLADVEDAVEQVVVDYFDSLTVGDAVRELALSALVAEVEGVVGASFTFNGGGADIVPLITEIPVLDVNTVTT